MLGSRSKSETNTHAHTQGGGNELPAGVIHWHKSSALRGVIPRTPGIYETRTHTHTPGSPVGGYPPAQKWRPERVIPRPPGVGQHTHARTHTSERRHVVCQLVFLVVAVRNKRACGGPQGYVLGCDPIGGLRQTHVLHLCLKCLVHALIRRQLFTIGILHSKGVGSRTSVSYGLNYGLAWAHTQRRPNGCTGCTELR